MDHVRFKIAMANLYSVIDDLADMFPERPFTPDGHLVGSLGECLVADAYDLELMPPSNKGYDAIDTTTGRKVEIKATQGQRVAFRSEPEHCIIILINKDGSFDEKYNGPGSIIWEELRHKRLPSNGQYQISLNRLAYLQRLVPNDERINRTDH
ncbi:DUF6998 domain-containing protein [Candidatus Neomarinimicrobiota bacterium]